MRRKGTCTGHNSLVIAATVIALLLFGAALAQQTPGDWTRFIEGSDFGAWREPIGDWKIVGDVSVNPTSATLLAWKPGTGVIVNGAKGRTNNLLTKMEHGDVEAHVEFMIPKGSNSGVYFMGRYEIQIYDSFGVKSPKYSDCGGIYERWKNNKGYEGHGPRVNAARKPGEWQTFDVIFRAPRFDASGKKTANAVFVKVVHNGVVIHENVEVTGPTHAAALNDEKPTGPLMIQGDHGPVAYANIRIRPIQQGLLATPVPAADAVGVPRIDPDYTVEVDQWWAGHPFNPESPKYKPEIRSPEPVVELTSGQKIQTAIDRLPREGGTITLAKGDYEGFEIVGRSNVHVISDGGAMIRGRSRVACCEEAKDYGKFDYAVSKNGRRDPRVWELYKHPTRNFYFKNLTFDGENKAVGAIGLQRVYDVVFDNCVFQNYVNPRKGHPGLVWGHEGINNIWCRHCRFVGESVYATYLDGCHGSGMIGCTVELSKMNSGGFLYLTNDDFTEDVNENGRTDREEERTAKYIVVYGCTFNGNSGGSAVQVTGENVLVLKNTCTGTVAQLLGSDPRYSNADPKLQYRFFHNKAIGNTVSRCTKALVLMKNIAPVSVPKDLTPCAMGKYVIRDNVVASTPQIVKHETLIVKIERDPAAFSDKGEIVGPNEIANNRLGETAPASSSK